MPDNSTIITPSDVEKAMLLIPIISQMGIQAVRRAIAVGGMTAEQLEEKARQYQEDTTKRNGSFQQRLEDEN